jgi:hypothetical protein
MINSAILIICGIIIGLGAALILGALAEPDNIEE